MAAGHDGFRIVLTTADSSELAERIARGLVERRLAACVNIVRPVRSIYRWKGEIVADDEQLLLIKTRSERLASLRSALRDLHSYEVPECVSIEIDDGDSRYLEWLTDAVRDPA